MQQFYNYKREKVDLFQTVLEQKVKHSKDLVVFIGTDSISVGGQIHYFIVVAFRYHHNGAHFIYTKDKVPTYRFETGKPDIETRLRREYHLTLDLAEKLVASEIIDRQSIIVEFDYNNVVDTISKRIVPESRGLAAYYGYQSLAKYGESVVVEFETGIEELNEQIAVKAANHLCQGVS